MLVLNQFSPNMIAAMHTHSYWSPLPHNCDIVKSSILQKTLTTSFHFLVPSYKCRNWTSTACQMAQQISDRMLHITVWPNVSLKASVGGVLWVTASRSAKSAEGLLWQIKKHFLKFPEQFICLYLLQTNTFFMLWA